MRVKIPFPNGLLRVEREQALLAQSLEELRGKEWVAPGFLVDELGKGLGRRPRAAKCVCHEVGEIGTRQRSDDHACTRTGSANGGQGSEKRMSGADLVVAVRSHQKQVADIGVGRELFQKLERCRIHPLEVIEKEHHRMFFARKHRHELPEHPLEALLRLQRRKVRDRGLGADDETRDRERD